MIGNKLKTTPDHIIVLDYLIYRCGDPTEQKLWEDIKADLKELAHDRI